MPFTEPGLLHRLAIVVRDIDEAQRFFVDVLGARSFGGALDGSDPERQREIVESEGAVMRLVWLGPVPVVLLGPTGFGGPADSYLARYGGPGIHSLAWEITDMWSLEHQLRERGVGITGVSVEGRHFFMHPRDTHGLLIEWTDGLIGEAQPGTDSLVKSLGWVTGVVADAEATAAFLSELAKIEPASPRPAGPADEERTLDLDVGPVTVRLVSPVAPESRYASALERGPGWSSATFVTADLDAALATLDASGVATLARDGDRAWTDPEATLGIQFEWTH